ncbi:MAG: hypothetical protein WCS92_04300 [Candidatus Babeliales bacterium]|jgi:hypothetical protein
MKKFLSLGFVASVLCSPVSAMESKDMDMSGEQQPATAPVAASSTFDMSSLQEAINAIAYNGTVNHLSYFDKSQDTDFIREMFKRYSALQRDLIQLQQTMPPESFKQAFDEINKAMTSIISSEDVLKFTYLSMTRKFNSEQDVTPEMIAGLMGYIKQAALDLNLPANELLEGHATCKSSLYKLIKLRQEKREAFYSLLLKPHLNREYQAILRGEISDLSEEFLQELITILTSCILKVLRLSIEQQLHAPVIIMPGLESTISAQIKAKRTVVLLLLKHFGEINGFDII